MPWKSIIDEITENHPLWEIKPQLHNPGYIIQYRFGSHTKTRFYEALEKIRESIQYQKLNRGTLMTYKINDAYSLLKLIIHYEGKCSLYSAQEIDIQEILENY